jgi:hypothetical protein
MSRSNLTVPIADAPATAARLMAEFAARTGLGPGARDQRRYLWTDAFAVCNFLELFQLTSDQQYLHFAKALIDQVHSVLGRYRKDEARQGWISGLDDESGRRHPTAGGLRIGKPLKERDVDEPLDERLEWDRDGQYFHYITKWMHALCQATFFVGDAPRWAADLGRVAFERFARRSASGGVVGVYWKMSTELSRPLIPATGLHDALDGFITLREVRGAGAKSLENAAAIELNEAIESLSVLCQQRDWTTDDPLGLGGLLFDACRLCQLIGEQQPGDAGLLQEIMESCRRGLMALLAGRQLNRPLSHRLAFRELGLAIGLQALPVIADIITTSRIGSRPGLQRALELLLPYEALSEEIIRNWLPYAQYQDENWRAHQDINDVMLATALIPNLFLSVGKRLSLKK